jgi:putative glutamine amidotransferase
MNGQNGTPRIGITPSTGYDEGKPFVGPKYLAAIEAAGCEPFPIDIDTPLHILLPLVASFDGILFPGGGDVNPSLYGQVAIPECGKPDHRRDQLELALADLARARCVPMLGICRGLQLINVAMGGTLTQHIPLKYGGTTHWLPDRDGVTPMHHVRIEPDTRLHAALGEDEIPVNSTHHQCVETLAEGLATAARADEGFIEAFEGVGPQFILAVQWHPERSFETDEYSRAIFRMFREAIH